MAVLDKFESAITRVLLVLMCVVVLLATVELGWILVTDVLTPPLFLLEIDELLGVFGQFLVVLIGIELVHSMKAYADSREIHLEAVLVVAVIAVARKIVVLHPDELPPAALLGIAAVTLALAIGYYLVRRSHRENGPSKAHGGP